MRGDTVIVVAAVLLLVAGLAELVAARRTDPALPADIEHERSRGHLMSGLAGIVLAPAFLLGNPVAMIVGGAISVGLSYAGTRHFLRVGRFHKQDPVGWAASRKRKRIAVTVFLGVAVLETWLILTYLA